MMMMMMIPSLCFQRVRGGGRWSFAVSAIKDQGFQRTLFKGGEGETEGYCYEMGFKEILYAEESRNCEREREREEGVKKNGGFAKNLYNIWVQGT